MGQVPVVQPTYFQYRKPPIAPIASPANVSQFFLKNALTMLLTGIFNDCFPIKQFSTGKFHSDNILYY